MHACSWQTGRAESKVSIRQQAKAKAAKADLSDELADSEDDGGLSDHADEAGPVIIDDDEDEGGSGASDDQDGASEGKLGILVPQSPPLQSDLGGKETVKYA